MNIKNLFYKVFFCVLLSWSLLYSQVLTPTFNYVVIWGHKLHTHTHSYIHAAFYKAFKYLGYNVLWLDKDDNIANFDLSNSLFITEGQVDLNIPLRNDCFYVLHNCNLDKYKKLYDAGKCLLLQVYVHDVLSHYVKQLDDYIYFEPSTKTIYMPWATDLLPDEIDEMKKNVKSYTKENTIYWVGSIWNSYYGNESEINLFKIACCNANITFQHTGRVDPEENIRLVQKSLIAPAIQGKWQCDVGYIPCRIFKNISYGAFGITNSKTVYELFKGKIIYNPDCYQLLFDALERIPSLHEEHLFELMDFVKEKHTYLNRIEMLLTALHMINEH